MTTSINRDSHDLADLPLGAAPDAASRPRRLVRGVQAFTAVTALAGVSFVTVAFSLDHWRAALVGAVLVVLAGIAGAVWVAHLLVADRRAFYERGKADGWHQCWIGEKPDPDDPLLP